jgi:hypothetical protein
MDADWSIELGRNDPVLEFPWSSEDGSQQFVDLSYDLASLDRIPEGRQYRELAAFLHAVNAPSSPWITTKCDVWFERELAEAEQIYDAEMKMCSYIDLVRRERGERFSFELHENFVKHATSVLQRTTDEAMACEFVARRCWYHCEDPPASEPGPGFYVTLYLFGYGNDEPHARGYWNEALTRVASVLVSPLG